MAISSTSSKEASSSDVKKSHTKVGPRGELATEQSSLVFTTMFMKLFSRDFFYFYAMVGVVTAGLWMSWLFKAVLENAEEMATEKPEYPFPKHSEASMFPVYVIALSLYRYLFVTYLTPPFVHFLKPCLGREQLVRAERIATAAFKASYFIAVSAWGYYLLKDTTFLGPQLLGSGSFENIWVGYPYYDYPQVFKTYYVVSFAYHFHSLIFHIFFQEPRSDYMEMLLHHTVTCFLIYLSFVLNYIHVGVSVIFVHDLSDIFVYGAKIFVDGKYRWIIIPYYIIVVVAFGYCRLCVYPLIVYWGAYKCEEVAQYPILGRNISLTMLLMLLALHIYWYFLLLKVGTNKLAKGKSAEDDVSQIRVDLKDYTDKELVEAERMKEGY